MKYIYIYIHKHVKIITNYADLIAYKQTAGRDGTAETGEQSTTSVS